VRNLLAIVFLVLPVVGEASNTIIISKVQMQTLGISVAPLAQPHLVMSNHLPGEIVVPINQERMVSAPQEGLIDSLQVAVGQSVKKGQALAHLSSAGMVALQRDYLQAKTQQRQAGKLLERDRELFKEGIIAERRFLSTQSNHEEISLTIAQRQQALKLAGMGEGSIRQLESKGQMASGLTIVAPMDGVVLEQMVTIGQRIDTAAAIYRIARMKPLWLEIHAPLDILNFAHEGMRVSIPKYQAEGKIINIIRNVNKNDQTVHLRAEISTGVDQLSPGQFIEAEITRENVGRLFSIPKAALIRNAQKSYMFVQTATGFTVQPITVVSEESDHAVISGNLTGSERVAVTGTSAIKAAWNSVGGE
jgi:RND family efflux transporter MFP subunit